jgi:hypothetical protein
VAVADTTLVDPSQPAPVELTVPTEIATLPPLEVTHQASYPTSPRTGEPKRPAVLMVAIVACWLSVATTIVAFGQWWWQAAHIPTFHASARLLTWTQPDPVSALAITLVLVIAAIAVVMVAAAGLVGYNAWTGQRWVRVAGLICFLVTGLSFLVSWWFTAAMAPLAVGVGLLWLPPVRRFFDAMAASRTVTPIVHPTTDIRYGPQPLIGRR